MQITDTSTVARVSDEGVLRLWYDPEEEAAIRDDQLLHLQADHDWADDVQEIIRSDIGNINDGDVLEEIFLYPYRRAPKEFKGALLEGPELRFIRERMRDAEQECILRPEGAKIFVWPHQYTAVIEALKSKVRCKDIELHASTVIISQSLVSSLEASIATILTNKNVRPNREGIACVANEEKTYLITEKRCTGGLITESDALEDWNP